MMRRKLMSLLALCCLTGALLAAQNVPTKAAEAAGTVVPVDKLNSGGWAARHAAIVEKVKSTPDARLILAGDSITHNYEKSKEPDENFVPIWQKHYAPRKAVNLGISGDTTLNLLWRLQNGELDGIQPSAVVVLIGTNDTNRALREGAKADKIIPQTEAGIDAVVAELQKKLPETRVLLLGILPSGISAEKTAIDQTINKYLAEKYKNHSRVTFLDLSPVFHVDAKLNEKLFYDQRLPAPRPALHPDTVGQRRMAEAIEPILAKLLGETPITPESAR